MKELTTDDRRTTRLCGLLIWSVFAICLILNAVAD